MRRQCAKQETSIMLHSALHSSTGANIETFFELANKNTKKNQNICKIGKKSITLPQNYKIYGNCCTK